MSDDNILIFEQRKRDHITHALNISNQSIAHNLFDNVILLHEAIPEINFSDISLEATRLGKNVAKPFFISSMTAGHPDAAKINFNLLAACQATGWGMAVGSQRKQLLNKSYDEEWRLLRKNIPNVEMFANLGITQLAETNIDTLKRLADSINASGFIIHCNALQEAIQPEGTPNFTSSWSNLEKLTKLMPIPIIIKETGCGFSGVTMKKLDAIGVAAIDVSGMGGTHWGKIEGNRAQENTQAYLAGKVFANWGIPTVSCLLSAQENVKNCEVWASGGIRDGLDAAKAIALGAHSVGFAKKMLAPALESSDNVVKIMQQIEYECKIAMFCTNNSNLEKLKNTKYMVNNNVIRY